MQINVTSTNLVVSKKVKEELTSRIKSVFGRTQDRITKASVTLSDVNGPKGGRDKECKVKLTLPGHPTILVMARKDNMFKAIATALSTANITLKKKLKKHRELQRQQILAALGRQQELVS